MNDGTVSTSVSIANRRYLGTGAVVVGNAGRLVLGNILVPFSFSGSAASPTLCSSQDRRQHPASQRGPRGQRIFKIESGAVIVNQECHRKTDGLDLNTNLNAAPGGGFRLETIAGANIAMKIGGIAIQSHADHAHILLPGLGR